MQTANDHSFNDVFLFFMFVGCSFLLMMSVLLYRGCMSKAPKLIKMKAANLIKAKAERRGGKKAADAALSSCLLCALGHRFSAEIPGFFLKYLPGSTQDGAPVFYGIFSYSQYSARVTQDCDLHPPYVLNCCRRKKQDSNL